MATIDWEEYKEYKKHSHRDDKLQMVIDFIKSYYNINSPVDIYDMLKNDEVAQMFLERKEIVSAEGLEDFMFQK